MGVVAAVALAVGAVWCVRSKAGVRHLRRGRRWVLDRLSPRPGRPPATAIGQCSVALSSAVRSGQSLRTALEQVSQSAEGAAAQLGALSMALDHGAPLSTAIGSWSRSADTVEARLLGGALLVGTSTGGRLGDALDSVAVTIAVRSELDAERRALSSQAMTTARLLVIAPALFGVVAAMIDRRVAHVLLGGPAGWVMVLVAGSLDALAWWWMVRLMRGADR